MKLTEKFDISFTSPPYLNMFDYYEVYKIELLLGGYINTREDWQQKRSISLRSNLNTKLLKSDKVNSSLLNNYLSKLTDEELASKTAIMINNYFFDMNEVLLKVLKHLKKGGYFFIVVGNSSYFNKPILVDEILAELGKEIGFEVVELIYSRKLNTSSQQMKNLKVIDKILLRETIIVLRKKYESKPKI
jgi:site-specific DNA-methyltransferase (adenine-specific)